MAGFQARSLTRNLREGPVRQQTSAFLNPHRVLDERHGNVAVRQATMPALSAAEASCWACARRNDGVRPQSKRQIPWCGWPEEQCEHASAEHVLAVNRQP